MPFERTLPFETPRDRSWNLKCHPRAIRDSLPIRLRVKRLKVEETLGDDASLKLGHEDSLGVSWRLLRRKRRFTARKFVKAVRRTVKKRVARPINKVAKDTVKAVVKMVPKRLRTRVAKAVKDAKKNIKKAVRKGKRKMGKALAKKMMPAVMKLIVKLTPRKYKGLFREMTPHLVKFDMKNAVRAAVRFLRPYMVVWLLKKFEMNSIFFECGLKDYLFPVANPKYEIRVALVPLDTKSPGCEGNSMLNAKGPHKFIVSRTYKGKDVCKFEFGMDAYNCHGTQYNCCQKWSWSFPRFSMSDYKPHAQHPDHDCKRWYLSTLGWTQPFVSIALTMSQLRVRKHCINSGTCKDTDYCTRNKCNDAKVGGGCTWNATGKRFADQLKPGYCQAKRV